MISKNLFVSSLLLMMLALQLTSCGKKRSSKNHGTVQPQSLSTCQQIKQRYENGTYQLFVENKKTVTIRREFQRVLRYSCVGKLLTDRIETVRSPKADIELKPYHELRNLRSIYLFNATTCDTTTMPLPNYDLPLLGLFYPVTGNDKGKIKIKADLAPAVFTFRFKKGLNQVYYTYSENCRDSQVQVLPDGTSQEVCRVPGRKHSGIYNIEILYEESTRPDVLEFRDSCDKKPNESK